MDVDQTIRYLEAKYSGVKVKNFREDKSSNDPKGRCEFDLEINGKSYAVEGHLRDFQKMNKLFEQKVKKLLEEQLK